MSALGLEGGTLQFRPLIFSTGVILFAGSIRLAAQNTKADIVTFDAPGASASANFGIFPQSINDPGTITGRFVDNTVYHGFST